MEAGKTDEQYVGIMTEVQEDLEKLKGLAGQLDPESLRNAFIELMDVTKKRIEE